MKNMSVSFHMHDLDDLEVGFERLMVVEVVILTVSIYMYKRA